MISDIETILVAFKGNWKPGIEEQSIRMAHAVALQGDTATASSILKFIAIPEPMKLQILGASLSPTGTPPATVESALTASVALEPKMMPEPLLSDSGASMSIPVVPESNIHIEGENKPVVPAFESDLSQVVQTVDTQVVPEVALPSGDTSPVSSLGVEHAPVSTEMPSVVVADTARTMPDTPISALPHERDQLFSKAFAAVQVDAANETSRPMVRNADNIPVIHTYEEPPESEMSKRRDLSEQSEKGIKPFQVLGTVMRRALDSGDTEIMTSAIAQWQRLNTEFPDYKTYHRMEWSALEGVSVQLQNAIHSPVKASTIAPTPQSAPTVSDSLQNSAPKTFVIDTVPAVDVSAKPNAGGYFAAAVQSNNVNSSTNTTTTPEVVENKTGDSDIVAPSSGSGYFARKIAIPHQEVQSEQSEGDPIIQPDSAKQSTGTVDDSTAVDLVEYVLDSGVRVTKNMTITGDSVYRVARIVQTGTAIYVVFTDEILYFRVPVAELSRALDNVDTQPDEFFAQFKSQE
jgi:hypothetical protein